MDWVREFYEKQYAWADWSSRWADPPSDDASIAAHVNAVRRMAGAGNKRILELGSGTGHVAVGLANAGHEVVAVELLDELAENTKRLAQRVQGGSLVAICGDFYEVDMPGPFDVVAYFDGFGIGNDADQRRILQRVSSWLTPDGCALIDVFAPWYWAKAAGGTDEFPEGSGVWYRDTFDADGSRLVEEMWREGHEQDVVSQSLRCYAPVDVRLLVEGTGLRLANIEPYSDESYARACPLNEAMMYLARLVHDDLRSSRA
jgi:SAM-dependent methyltransferase